MELYLVSLVEPSSGKSEKLLKYGSLHGLEERVQMILVKYQLAPILVSVVRDLQACSQSQVDLFYWTRPV